MVKRGQKIFLTPRQIEFAWDTSANLDVNVVPTDAGGVADLYSRKIHRRTG